MNFDIRKNLTLLMKTGIFIIITFIFAELIAIVVFYINNKQVFYFRSQFTHSAKESFHIQEELVNEQPLFLLDSYFGLIRPPGLTIRKLVEKNKINLDHLYILGKIPKWLNMETNNHGFFSSYSYPYRRTKKNEYIIGIFGGSVAQWFSIQGKERLLAKLYQHPFFKNKTITVLNFGSGGYKQPQQLQILTYFLSQRQELDFVINIDGFNETVFSISNMQLHLHPSMPSNFQLLPLLKLLNKNFLSMDELKTFSQIATLEEKVKYYRQSAAKNIFASLYIFNNTYSHYLEQKLTYIKGQFQIQLSKSQKNLNFIYHLLPPIHNSIDSKNHDDWINNWSNSSLLMHQLLTARSIPYLHIIQPNQYYSKKIFSDEEKYYALLSNSPYKNSIETGYPLLEKEGKILAKRITLKNAISIFDKVKETIYSDSCCHYNQRGNEILADFIAREILILLTKQKSDIHNF